MEEYMFSVYTISNESKQVVYNLLKSTKHMENHLKM